MAIDTTINLIQTLNRSISGIKQAPNLAQYPTVLHTANLPYAITWPASGEWFHQGQGGSYKRENRNYRIIVYIEPLGQNDIPSRAVEAVTLLEQFKAKYLTPTTIALANPPTYQVTIQVDEDKPITDTGLVSDLLFSGTPYHGFEIEISVRELWA